MSKETYRQRRRYVSNMLHIIGDIVPDNNLFYSIGMIVAGFGTKSWRTAPELRVICALRAALVEKSMNDEMKGKSGKVKVMYVRSDDDSDKRTHNPRTGKGGGRPGKSRADGGRRPARDDKQSQPRDRKWEDSPWRTVSRAPAGDETRKRPITVASVVKVILIQKFCVVSVRKKPASTAKMHVRHCSRAVRKRLFAPGLSRA